MVSFASDYIAGAHPKVLTRLVETNLEPASGYGADIYCESARAKIREACGLPHAEVEFFSGGTQVNAFVISTMLRDWEGVVSAASGHIYTHESGAIEHAGHKILALPEHEGKIDAGELSDFLRRFYADEIRENAVYPGMVYISHPTEYGTLYSKSELIALSEICRNYEILLYLDGARLGYGLMSRESDLNLSDIAELCDVFYIGGTKVGALCGEALVYTKRNKPPHFINAAKKRGALLAKGRLFGVQFDALFTDGLYYQISKHAIDMAEELKSIAREKGLRFFIESPTNQQFFIFENEYLACLKKKIGLSFWENYDDEHTVIRLATSWSTTEGDLEVLRSAL